jgi:hypothetical protein
MRRKATTLVVAMAAPASLRAADPALGAGSGSSHAGWLLRQADARDPGNPIPGLQSEIGGTAGSGSLRSGRGKVLPLAMSLAVPGLGEAYLGHIRGYPMMAIDVASWLLLVHYNEQGHKKRDAYYAYAQEHWSETRMEPAYDITNPADAAGLFYYPGFTITVSPQGYKQIPLWVDVTADRREYFENLGKWDQFVFGWDDFTDPRTFITTVAQGDAQYLTDPRVSAHRETYRAMRTDSNKQFTNRDRLLYFNIATRIFSFFQVAYLEGLLGGGQSQLEVAGHPVSLIAEPAGIRGGTLGVALGY